MKWKVKVDAPNKGTIVIVSAFLWTPKLIGDEKRWLETATWEQIWKVDNDGSGRWVIRKWVDPVITVAKDPVDTSE
jgi:hypothetical protein